MLIPDGRGVHVLRVRHSDGYGADFKYVVTVTDIGEDKEVRRDIRCHPTGPSVFLCEHCYFYLEKWINWEELPDRRIAFPNDPEPLHFPGELYEVINSRKQTRGITGTLQVSELEYDGIENSLDNRCQDDIFPGCWRGGHQTARAIQQGLRGEGLIPALMYDARAWMFMQPDIWPVPSPTPESFHFTEFMPGELPTIGTLPIELLFPLLSELPLVSLFNLSSTCRALRNLITHPTFLDRVLREAILRGSLRWIFPVETMPGNEPVRAFEALRKWIHEDAFTSDGTNDRPGVENHDVRTLLASSQFPHRSFVRACWNSDSMMNRKRLWGQIKQFERLWRDYRLNGWQVKRFYASATLAIK